MIIITIVTFVRIPDMFVHTSSSHCVLITLIAFVSSITILIPNNPCCDHLHYCQRWVSYSPGTFTYLWLVGDGRMVVIVVIIVPHSSIPYYHYGLLGPKDPD